MQSRKVRDVIAAVVLLFCSAQGSLASPRPSLNRWSEKAAGDWYARQPWLVGSNYIPSTSINELEMWQADTFDPARMDTELGWAESLEMNTMRVFLHDLLWQQDPKGFQKRVDIFLHTAAKHHIRPLFVLFDSVWDPIPTSANSARPSRESIIQDGCRAPALPP